MFNQGTSVRTEDHVVRVGGGWTSDLRLTDRAGVSKAFGLTLEYRFVQHLADHPQVNDKGQRSLRQMLMHRFGHFGKKEKEKEKEKEGGKEKEKEKEKSEGEADDGAKDKGKEKEKEKKRSRRSHREKEKEKEKVKVPEVAEEAKEMERSFLVHVPSRLARLYHPHTLRMSANVARKAGIDEAMLASLLDQLPEEDSSTATIRFYKHLREGISTVDWDRTHATKLEEDFELPVDEVSVSSEDEELEMSSSISGVSLSGSGDSEGEGSSEGLQPPKRSGLGSSGQLFKEMGAGARKMLQEEGRKVPLVVMLHGTNEYAWDTELHVQKDGSKSWLDLADKENFVVAFLQSQKWRRPWQPNFERTGWRPGDADSQYVQEVLRIICKRYKCIDQQRIYAVGFSNGGLFLCDLLVRGPGHLFAANCNYMGGLDSPPPNLDLSDEEYNTFTIAHVAQAKHKVPTFIITGDCDDNRFPCIRAKEALEKNGWPILFEECERATHQVLASKTEAIWSFLAKHSLADVAFAP